MATNPARLKLLNRTTVILVTVAVLACSVAERLVAQDRFAEYDLVMYHRPSLPRPNYSSEFPEGLPELWLRALERPDPELQRMVIDTFAIAHREGLPGLEEAKPRLVELLDKPDQRLDVLRSTAQTLIALDAQDQAETLAALSTKHGVSIAQIVEPALARWKSPVMEKVWLQRVSQGGAGRTLMTLAIDGLGQLQTDQAAEPLERIVVNVAESSQVRFSAARALGLIRPTGLIELAERLIEMPSNPTELHPLLAIDLMVRHDDPDSIELLTSLVSHDSTAVQANALGRLFHIDVDLVDRHADTHVTSTDASVRLWCARAMIRKQDLGRIELLSTLLDDVNPNLRREVASGLVGLAELPGFREDVIRYTTNVLEQDSWRGCEQAAVILTKLDHKPAGPRMVELLGHQRGEVQVASAWGLTRLRIPELLPGMLDHARSVYAGFRSGQLNDGMPGKSLHMAHLFIAFGDQRYREADSLMREYLPKDFSIGAHARTAAAWGLGLIYEDDLQEDLAKVMEGRLNDTGGLTPELEFVRWACAVSLGRMKAESTLPSLRKSVGEGEVGVGCYWAIEQMTGEPIPELRSITGVISGWFLEPIREQ